MESKHTPGPWRATEIQGDHFIHAHPYEYDIFVAEIPSPVRDLKADRDTGTGAANARLIAAAPELLSALEEIAEGNFFPGETLSPMEQVQAIARAAIAKSKGE